VKIAIWLMVWVLALFPWWAIPATAWLVPMPWDEAARIATTTCAAVWTPFVILAALLLSERR
jgi:hypothetical protein